ncbi:MAG: hypothetical protein AMJ81_01530 [Phycisphaerae bacterium SM23_33]|nr:MAG: hypothetical protein AMJ81_01530 [Phycisphaerae bacterium SM23_33]
MIVAALRAGGRATPAPGPQDLGNVQVVMAATDLPAMAVVDTRSVLTKSVPKTQAPKGYIPDPVQVVGKVLARPVVEGQPFTADCFATKGTGTLLAAALPKGMRAVTIPLAEHASLMGLLYPGSLVDVLASFKLSSRRDELGEAISIVLLQGIEVLAIEDRTIVSGEETGESKGSRQPYGRSRNVTLLVSPKQAEALQLAASNGTLSLAMRNPLDVASTDKRATVLSELSDEFLSRLAEMIQPSPPSPPEGLPAAAGQTRPEAAPAAPVATQPAAPTPPQPPTFVAGSSREAVLATAQWQTEVIRAGQKEKQTVSLPREFKEDQK